MPPGCPFSLKYKFFFFLLSWLVLRIRILLGVLPMVIVSRPIAIRPVSVGNPGLGHMQVARSDVANRDKSTQDHHRIKPSKIRTLIIK